MSKFHDDRHGAWFLSKLWTNVQADQVGLSGLFDPAWHEASPRPVDRPSEIEIELVWAAGLASIAPEPLERAHDARKGKDLRASHVQEDAPGGRSVFELPDNPSPENVHRVDAFIARAGGHLFDYVGSGTTASQLAKVAPAKFRAPFDATHIASSSTFGGSEADIAVEITNPGDTIDVDPGDDVDGKVVWTLEEIHDNFFRKGDWGPELPLTYSFPQVVPAGYLKPNGVPKEGQEGEDFSPFHQVQINTAIALMDQLGDIIAPDFTNAGLTTDAVFRFMNTTQEAGGGHGTARANGPWQENEAVRGDIWVFSDKESNFRLDLGGSGRSTLAHEIGHILALAHPGDYDASDDGPTYDNSADYFQDSNQYTLMSYFGAGNTLPDKENTGAEDTFLLHDIYALQRHYGVDMSTRTGDTTYGYNGSTGGTVQDSVYNLDVNHSPRFTIWDAGGEDTLDASGMDTSAELDLRPGSFSSLGARLAGDFTIEAGDRFARIEIETLGDTLNESLETFSFNIGTNNSVTVLTDLAGGNIGGAYATGTIWDSSAPRIMISASDATVTEGGALQFVLSLDKASSTDVSVDWEIQFQSASASDLAAGTPLIGTTTFSAGDTEATLTFLTAVDALTETEETFRLRLSNPSVAPDPGGAPIPEAEIALDPTHFIGTIHETSIPTMPTVTVASSQAQEGDNLTFVISLDRALEKDLVLYYDVLPGTASWHDLVGENSFTHNVSIAYDSAVDGTEHDAFDKSDVWIENAVGGAGADLLHGNEADNRLDGGAGNDSLLGDDGDDRLLGGEGDDTFFGGRGADEFFGGAGTDTLILRSDEAFWNVDLLGGLAIGATWTDTLQSIENVTTSLNDDEVILSYASNSVSTSGGNDTIYSTGSGNDVIDGGWGLDDLLSYENADFGVTVDLQISDPQPIGVFFLTPQQNQIIGIEHLTGSQEDDVLRGSFLPNSLLGLGGDDILYGLNGINLLNGGSGNDTIISGFGDDSVFGGAGADLHSFIESGVGVVAALYQGTATGAGIGTDTWSDVEGLIGSDYDDHLGGWMQTDTLYGGGGADLLESYYGHDTAYGGDGRDAIYLDTEVPPPNEDGDIREGDDVGYGGDSGDTIFGGRGHDTLFGEAGTDTLFGGIGNDELFGGKGSDTLEGGEGDDLMDGGTARDVADYRNATSAVTVDLNIAGPQDTGGAGKDTLTEVEGLLGSDYDDHLYGKNHSGGTFQGRSGDDTIEAGSGDDQSYGGEGDDLLRDGPGNDVISGGIGVDTYHVQNALGSVAIDLGIVTAQDTGGADTDVIVGVENLVGSSFGDRLIGDAGANELRGVEGDDTLNGMVGNDRLEGGDGNDTLLGGLGDDTLVGGVGNDILSGGLGNNRLFGGNGSDTASYADAAAGVEVMLGTIALQQTGGAGEDLILGVENLTGSDHDDTLAGDGAANIIVDGLGTDTVNGNGGADTLYLGQIEGDQYDGGGGIDLLIVDDASVHSVDLHLGIATGDGALAPADAILNIENVQAGSAPIAIIGSDSSNTLMGGEGNDTIIGRGGADDLRGNAGNDTIEGGSGADSLDGGVGIDTASYAGSAAAVFVHLDGTSGNGGDSTGDTLTEIENLIGSDFNDILFGDGAANSLYGGDGIDVLQGGAGADVLNGGDGLDWAAFFDAPGPLVMDLVSPTNSSSYFAEDTLIDIEILGGASNFSNTFFGDAAANVFIAGSASDTLAGGGGGDLLQGGGAADTLNGQAGSDAVMGNMGNDVLYGGADADGFYFQDNDGDDIVKDFSMAEGDKFVFISANFTEIGDLSFSEVGGNAVITYGTATITVEGISQAQIDSDASLYLWF